MRVLLVVAQQYNGHELWVTLAALQRAQIGFDIVSTKLRIEDEITFQPNLIELTLDTLNPEVMQTDKYDGIIIVSGNMALTEAYWDDERVLKLIRDADASEKIVAAICCSVPTIREAARGKRVSFFPLIRSRERLVQAGAILSNISCTVDGRLITAEHQMSSQIWAEAIATALHGRESSLVPGLVDSGMVPNKRERMPDPDIERLKHVKTKIRKPDSEFIKRKG